MPRKLTTEEVIERFKEVHGDKYGYNRVLYKSADKKVEIYCKICDLYFWQRAGHHWNGKGCAKCGGNQKPTTKEVIERFKKVHGNKYKYDRVVYKGKDKKVEIYCKICEEYFEQIAKHHWRGSGCAKCSGNQKLTTEEVIERFKKVHGDKYKYDRVVYNGANKEVEIYCKICDLYFWQIAGHHWNGKGCAKCSGNQKPTTEEVIEGFKKVHGDKYKYNRVVYKGASKEVEIYCKTCEEYFWQLIGNHRSGKGCAKCSGGSISTISQQWLDSIEISQNILIKREVPIKIGNKRFKVDGYNVKTNIIYEFNGDYWHGNPKIYKQNNMHPVCKKTYGELYQRTLKKKAILEKAGYKVISMWENDYRNQLK